MSLMRMIEMQNATSICESFVLGPNNSASPYDIWFDRDWHAETPRIKIQVKVGVGDKDKSKYMSYDPVHERIFESTRPKGKKNVIPTKHSDVMIDFLKENSHAIRQYYKIDPETCKVIDRGISEQVFIRIIVRRANEFFNRESVKARLN